MPTACPSYPMRPRSRSPSVEATCLASSRAGSPGAMPQRGRPTFTSTSTPICTAAARAASASSATAVAESAATLMSTLAASLATRSPFPAPSTSLAMRISALMPSAVTISASLTVAQVTPVQEPAANWRRAIAGVLWALKCGRSLHGRSLKKAAMRWMLRSIARASTRRAGVGISCSFMKGSSIRRRRVR